MEVKSFISASPLADLEHALGQYLLYEDFLQTEQSDRQLYLAIRNTVYNGFFQEKFATCKFSIDIFYAVSAGNQVCCH